MRYNRDNYYSNIISICRMETVKIKYTAENMRKLTETIDSLIKAGYELYKDESELRQDFTKSFGGIHPLINKYYISYSFWFHSRSIWMDYYISVNKF